MENKETSQLIINLHTAARRYCNEQMERFTQLKRLPGGVYEVDQSISQETYLDIMPRLLFLNSLRWEIQRIVPTTLQSMNQAINLFIESADKAAKFSGGSETSTSVIQSIQQEQDAFIQYIQAFSTDKLKLVQPLPHLRALLQEEHIQLLRRLSEIWGVQVDGGWFSSDYYPFESQPNVVTEKLLTLEAFYLGGILEHNVEDIIKKALTNKKVDLIYIFEQSYPGLECEISQLDLNRALRHIVGVSFSDDLDWILFSSSKETITIGGKWLLEVIKDHWTNWQQYVVVPFDYS